METELQTAIRILREHKVFLLNRFQEIMKHHNGKSGYYDCMEARKFLQEFRKTYEDTDETLNFIKKFVKEE
jgi:hypothetical protein